VLPGAAPALQEAWLGDDVPRGTVSSSGREALEVAPSPYDGSDSAAAGGHGIEVAPRPEPIAQPGQQPAPPTVTAVILARRVEHLGAVLRAVAAQTRPPDRVVGVDAGGDPGIAVQLNAHTGDVLELERTATTGDAITAALAMVDAEALEPVEDVRGDDAIPAIGSPEPGREWVWLLDDRSVPSPQALAGLLAVSQRSADIAVAGCKVRGGPGGRVLVEAGSTTSRWGRRLTGVEDDEVDQGQLDGREDVLAVSGVGMLVRRDVWESLGGTDPLLRDDGADVELGRRVHLAGHRVVVAPDAVLTRPVGDLPPSQRQVRAAGPVHLHPAGPARRDAAYLRLVGASRWALPFVALSVLAGGLARLVLALAAKDPARGLASLAGAVVTLARPRRVRQGRRRVARAQVVSRGRLRGLQAGSGELGRWHRTRWGDRRPGSERVQAPPATLLDRPGEAADAAGRAVPLRISTGSVVGLVVALGAASVVGLWGAFGAGALGAVASGDAQLTAAALTPVPESLRDLWTSARSGWLAAGAGRPASADPFLGVLSLASVVAGGSPRAAVAVLLLGALPMAGVSAWWAAGAVTRRPGWRLVAGLAWAAAPSLLLAVGAGRLGAVVAHLALPVAARCLSTAALSPQRRTAWCWAGAAALAVVPVTTGAPVLLPAVVLMCVLVGAASRRTGVLVAALPALALAAPGLASAATERLALLADPGPAAAFPPATSWQLALGWPAGPQVWPGLQELPGLDRLAGPDGAAVAMVIVLSALPVLLAAAALPVAVGNGRVPRAARYGLAVAVVGLAVAVLASRTVLSAGQPAAGPAGDGSLPPWPVTLWPGGGTSLALLGLLVAGLAGTRARPAPAPRTAPRTATVVAAALVPALALVGWAAAGALTARADVTRDGGPALPAVVTDTADSPDQVRVLALRALGGGELAVSLLRGDGPAFESAGTLAPPEDAASTALARAAVDLASGVTDPRAGLAPFGVGAVVVLPADPGGPDPGGADPGGADPDGPDSDPDPATAEAQTADLVAALDNTAGLSPSGRVDALRAWRVEARSGPSSTAADRPAALRVVSPDGREAALPATSVGARTTLAAGLSGRVLQLAERRDDGWTATLDGRELTAQTVDGWAQGWQLPTGGGLLEVRHEPATGWWGWVQLALLMLCILVAVPVHRPRGAQRPRRPEPAHGVL